MFRCWQSFRAEGEVQKQGRSQSERKEFLSAPPALWCELNRIEFDLLWCCVSNPIAAGRPGRFRSNIRFELEGSSMFGRPASPALTFCESTLHLPVTSNRSMTLKPPGND